MRILIILWLLLATSAHAATTITSTGIAGSGFPVALSTANETYTLSENITCATTCFSIKANNITLNLNAKTATFGNSNGTFITNPEMETWADASTLSNWTVLSGTTTRTAAVVWGNYDATLSATASIKSSTVTAKGGQSYIYYATIKGTSADSYTISVRKASDNTVLATSTIGGDYLNRAFAMEDGSLNNAEQQYRPTVDTDVYLQIDCAGTSNKILHVAGISAANHYFVVSNSYQDTDYLNDLSYDLFGGSGKLTGLITNGTITQGAAKAVKSVAIQVDFSMSLSNTTVNMTGNNTAALNTFGAITVDTNTFNTDSILNFNRMHPFTTLNTGPVATGIATISNNTFNNDPEIALRFSSNTVNDSDTFVMNISGNIFRHKEQVTEGYAINLSGVNTTNIYGNDINPYQGRGILLDATANRSGYIDGTRNVTVRNNIIQNIHGFDNAEYGNSELEAVGIRIRNWGGTDPPEGHSNLKIYNNTISGYADSTTSHRTYGINITASAALDSMEIYNNTIAFTLNSSGGADWEAAGIALQGADMSGTGTIKIYNNQITGDVGLRLGGNDGSNVKNIEIYSNEITTSRSAILYYEAVSTMTNNLFYCNKIESTGAATYPLNLTTPNTTRTLSGENYSNNLFTTAHSSGYEVYNSVNYSAAVTSCNNGTLDINGGGSLGTASPPCTYGTEACYTTAGLLPADVTAPVTIANPNGGTDLVGSVSVTMSCTDALGCTGTSYCTGAACTPTTPYVSALSFTNTTILRWFSVDAAANTETTKSATFTFLDVAPITTASPASGPITIRTTVTLTPNETSTTKWCIGQACDATTGTTGTSAIVYPGEWLRYYSYDAALNTEAVNSVKYAWPLKCN